MGAPRETLSAKNPRIAHLRRLSGRRRSRSEHGQFIVEGIQYVTDAMVSGVEVDAIYIDLGSPDGPWIDRLLSGAAEHDVPVHWLEPGVLAKVADTVNPQPALAVVNGAPLPFDAWLAEAPSGLVLVLAGVADPGNAGTLVRTAEAVGASAVVFAADSVDPLSPKTVRSSAGSVLRVPLVHGDSLAEVASGLRAEHFRLIGTSMNDAVPFGLADLTGDVALVLGNEAHGVPVADRDRFDAVVSIPMNGGIESLNVAVAGSLIAFEAARQRGTFPEAWPDPVPGG